MVLLNKTSSQCHLKNIEKGKFHFHSMNFMCENYVTENAYTILHTHRILGITTSMVHSDGYSNLGKCAESKNKLSIIIFQKIEMIKMQANQIVSMIIILQRLMNHD